MNKNLLILILLISLFSISISFAVSEDLEVENAVDLTKEELDLAGLVEGEDYVVDEKGEVSFTSDKVNPGDYSWTYGNNSDNKNNQKPSGGIFPAGKLNEDYKNGFEGFVSKLENMRYYLSYAYDENGIKYTHSIGLYEKDVPYNSSANLNSYYAFNFEYKGENYNIFTNSDFINLNASQAIPIYVVGDSLYVGNPAKNITPNFKGYAVTDNGFRWTLQHLGSGASTNNQSNTIAENIGTNNNQSKSVNNENVSIISNDTANADGNNSSNILASAQTSNSLEKTGIPIAMLVLVLLSVLGLRRKD